jgi:hypothetical protein
MASMSSRRKPGFRENLDPDFRRGDAGVPFFNGKTKKYINVI